MTASRCVPQAHHGVSQQPARRFTGAGTSVHVTHLARPARPTSAVDDRNDDTRAVRARDFLRVKPERARRIREAISDCIRSLVETQHEDSSGRDRGAARVKTVLREHDIKLALPSPQLFAAVELPQEFSQAITVPVPVRTVSGRVLLVTVRVNLLDMSHGFERWRGALFGAELLDDGSVAAADVFRREDAALSAATAARAAAAESSPELPAANGRQAVDAEVELRQWAEELSDGDEDIVGALLDNA